MLHAAQIIAFGMSILDTQAEAKEADMSLSMRASVIAAARTASTAPANKTKPPCGGVWLATCRRPNR
jgi:hypothetical protein